MSSRLTRMLSCRPGEKLYVRRAFSGSLCSFFESLDAFRLASLRLFLLSGPAEASSDPSCFAGSCLATALCISVDCEFSAPPVDFLRLLFLRNGQMPMFPSGIRVASPMGLYCRRGADLASLTPRLVWCPVPNSRVQYGVPSTRMFYLAGFMGCNVSV